LSRQCWRKEKERKKEREEGMVEGYEEIKRHRTEIIKSGRKGGHEGKMKR
jgi:hypothetical protein